MTPKIIHFLWLNFNKKTDGILDETLTFFKDRIEVLHPEDKGWKINFISKWTECLESIKDEKWLLDLLDNDHVGPAHKSDALRYYYLYKMGGVWVDLSTFLVTSFDNLVEQNKEGFTCYYMPSNVCASWLIKLSSDIFENITMKNYINNIVPIQNNLINIRNPDFNFITENYFMIFSKNHEICKDVLDQLESFWNYALPRIKSNKHYCNELNMLMYHLFQEAYDITISNFPYLGLLNGNIKNSVKNRILKEYFDCSYFFNYLQLYLAVRNFSTTNRGRLTDIPNSEKKNRTINSTVLSSFSKELCESRSCNNKVITFADTNKNINLLSASYNRLSKWSDDRDKRISWENTLAGDILMDRDPKKVLKNLQDIEIYQLKYSSFTRSRSESINSLKRLFMSNIGLLSNNIEASLEDSIKALEAIKISGGSRSKIIKKKKSTKCKNKLSKKTYNKSSKKSPKIYKGPRGGIYLLRKGKKIYI